MALMAAPSWPIPVDMHNALSHHHHLADTVVQNPLFIGRSAAGFSLGPVCPLSFVVRRERLSCPVITHPCI